MKKIAITHLINKFHAAWDLMDHYSDNKILSQMNPVNYFVTYFINIFYFNKILIFAPTSSNSKH
jgi:hypothetical protein